MKNHTKKIKSSMDKRHKYLSFKKNFLCCINRFTSLCKNLFNLLEFFLAEAF